MPEKQWYVLRVQGGKEEEIKTRLLNAAKIKGFEDRIGEVIVPIERVSEIKRGQKKIVERKIFSGYLIVELDYAEDIWHDIVNVRGVGDFLGSGGPIPMEQHEIQNVKEIMKKGEEKPVTKVIFKKHDIIKIKEGPFTNFEGEVSAINPEKGLVTVEIMVFGRTTPVELELWQVELV